MDCKPIIPAYYIYKPSWMTDEEWEYTRMVLNQAPETPQTNRRKPGKG